MLMKTTTPPQDATEEGTPVSVKIRERLAQAHKRFNANDNSAEFIEPNMVVALEAPFYAQGLGALMIEDQFLVTESGVACMNSLTRSLVSV